MFTSYHISIPTLLADKPVQMPINILLAIPPYPRDPDQHIFNVPAMINELMGGSGWRVATQVMKPRVWATGWDNEQLRTFLTRPFGNKERAMPERALRGIRAHNFPGLRSLSKIQSNYPQYEVIHFVGEPQDDYHLRLGTWPEITFGTLIDALNAASTRLLILQLTSTLNETAAHSLAMHVVGSGGPAVLVVSGSDAVALDAYFLDLYANIIHNQPLTYAAQPSAERGLDVQLFYGEGGDELLRFDRFRDRLYDRIKSLREEAAPETVPESVLRIPIPPEEEYPDFIIRPPRSLSVGRIPELVKPFMHQSQVKAVESHIAAARDSFETKAEKIRVRAARFGQELDWSHETGGAIPVSETARNMPKLEAAMRDLVAEFRDAVTTGVWAEAERAPRVLNANFADLRLSGNLTERVLASNKGLEEDTEYALCVDVGPQWSTVSSIVKGRKGFPEQALPVTDQGGNLVQVVFVSEDFSPHLSSAQIWVPTKTGRSSPLVNGERAEKPGPVFLRLRTPSFPDDANGKYIEAHGRLCLYFGNNLLQSAVVKAIVLRLGADVELDRSNEIAVDFRLTGTFQDVELFTTRAVVLDAQAERDWLAGNPTQTIISDKTTAAESREFQVGLNLTLNDDGSKHRIMVKSNADLPPVWKPYNVTATSKLLSRARQELYNCFFQRNRQTCEVPASTTDRVIGLNAQNGKDYYQFFCDLRQLAIFGERLFNIVYTQVSLDGTEMTKNEWQAELHKALERTTVIQVARTGEAEYAFPWAMVYQYPLDDKDNLKPCEVIKEWNAAGVRTKGVEDHCPYEGTPGHDRNILCPYGFWGLKHYIEQPIPPLIRDEQGNTGLPGNVPRTINTKSRLNLSVGVTRDPHLSPVKIKDHLTNLAKTSSLNPPDGADEWSKVRDMLKSPSTSPDVVYFLCHGEYDDVNDQPYLGIGLPSGQYKHRVYPNDLVSWSRGPGMTSPLWNDPRPLIFINGCHTFALSPDQILNFVSTFAGFGASAVVGTEVSVLLPLAIEIAEMLFDAFLNFGMTLGQAMHQVRWKLANKGNLLGLAYTPYGQADLHLVKN